MHFIKKLFIFLFLFSLTGSAFAQPNGNGKSLYKKMKEADELFDFNDFKNALNIYKEIYKTDSLNGSLNYKIGVCIYSLRKEKPAAIPYFEKAKNEVNESDFYLGNLYHLTIRFEDALKAYNNYKALKTEKTYSTEEVDRLISITRNAMEFMAAPKNILIKNIGNVINSPFPDYVPLISADESIMIFTSRRDNSTGKLLDPYGEYFEDVYISYKKDTSWTTPEPISPNINSNSHDACVALSADGEELFIYRTNEDLTAGDLYVSKFTGTGWTAPEKLGSDINTEEGVEPSASLLADGQILYFSSNRPGGFGGKDIYKVVKLPNGLWSKAVNLGPMINTPYDDDAPFIHPDGKTLFFSSMGHKNMGGYDILKTELSEEGKWSTPENLGYPLNTVDNDIYFVLSVNGKTGYYSSKKPDTYGETDIYTINMVTESFDLTVIKGMVSTNDEVANPLTAKITLMDDQGVEVIGIYKSNSLTGNFILIVTPGKKYKILIEADGYYPHLGQIDSEKLELTTKLKKIEPNKKGTQ